MDRTGLRLRIVEDAIADVEDRLRAGPAGLDPHDGWSLEVFVHLPRYLSALQDERDRLREQVASPIAEAVGGM